jgi:hypothetical protein
MDFLKKANVYFIVIPLAAAVWAVLASTVFLKSANKDWDKTKMESDKSKGIIAKILVLDQDRMKLHKEKEKMGKFDYNTVIHKFSKFHGIPESGYALRATAKKRRKGGISQSATLTISNIEIVPFSKFLSEILFLWPNLECESLTVSKQNTGLDAWKTVMQFKYTFKK